ncbi:C-Jun-amino-terminal kinase-interacting protein 1a isoform X2 [Scophthalmus maximus]|uniref:C-Jun-amino-terminal kinase-interacting protein 1a isoform X2 n=1 Tax=Scophthalmus maximus TaxID=52904 RepID=UPI001FA85A88|nr:C-Jun-amino-terminal kinase-interacting protein 1a isoform X2 [Scophthalmus maximus]
MDKYRPKRPTTLALFPQLPRAGTQDSINNNSFGKKESWKESHSSSPHITGDLTPPDVRPKAEDKVRQGTRRPAPKPPAANETKGKTKAQTAAADSRTRLRDKQASAAAHTQSSNSPRTQRRAAAAAGGGGRGRGAAAAMKDRNQGKDGVKEERRTGRLCSEAKAKDKERNGPQRPREANGPKGRGAEEKGRAGAKGSNRGGGGAVKTNNAPLNQEVYLTANVVPRTPVAPRTQDKSQDRGQSHDGTQDNSSVMSRSSSEGGSNRMSLSSDTEGPPPGPLHPSVSYRINPDIREEDGEGVPTPCANVQNRPTNASAVEEQTAMDCTNSEVDAAVPQGDPAASRTVPRSETAAGLSYDSVKYTLVVDEHAQLELVSLKDCFHRYNEHNDDSDAETVYQSANEEEDPEYEQEMKRKEEARSEKRRKEAETKKRLEEDVKRRREEEVKRRRDVVARICKPSKVASKVASTAAPEDEESHGGRAGAPRSRKFLNLFAKNSRHYSTTGAGSFGLFSCVLDGVERQQSHRAAYRFVPRHADELQLETDDPVLLLNQSEDLWCQGYNMRTGATGIFPAFYAVKLAKDINPLQKDGLVEKFQVRFLGSVQVPVHKGSDVLCAAMQKVACNRRLAGQPPAACVLEVSVRGVKINVQDQCHSAHRCFHFFQLKNISFCSCHPKHSKYFGFITKHPDQQRFACHVVMSDTTLHPLAESVGRAFQQYYKEHIGYSCPTEDIFIE